MQQKLFLYAKGTYKTVDLFESSQFFWRHQSRQQAYLLQTNH